MLSFSSRVIQWQHRDGRHHLPWQVKDPYSVWLSEVMLQQTQVTTVIPYFLRFIAHFPNVASLAAASTDEVLSLWSGLGYYARARNLHRAAREIMLRFDGTFPDDLALLTSLPGIGRSTAAAIATFSFGMRAPILDGNVKRILARWAGIEGNPGVKAIENKLWQLAESLLPNDQLTAYTQGLMDLGSRICTPKRPACLICPVKADCIAHLTGQEETLPTPKQKKQIPERYTVMLLIQHTKNHKKHILLQQRPSSGIWGGLWSLPEVDDVQTAAKHCRIQWGLEINFNAPQPAFVHTFTHFRLFITPLSGTVHTETMPAIPPSENWAWFEPPQALSCGLPSPVRFLISTIDIL